MPERATIPKIETRGKLPRRIMIREKERPEKRGGKEKSKRKGKGERERGGKTEPTAIHTPN